MIPVASQRILKISKLSLLLSASLQVNTSIFSEKEGPRETDKYKKVGTVGNYWTHCSTSLRKRVKITGIK